MHTRVVIVLWFSSFFMIQYYIVYYIYYYCICFATLVSVCIYIYIYIYISIVNAVHSKSIIPFFVNNVISCSGHQVSSSCGLGTLQAFVN